MKSSLKLLLITLFIVGSVIGCDGCFDDELTNKVDAPNFTFVKGTNYTVKMSSDTKNAEIKYTIDGTDPKTSSTAVKGTEVDIDFFTTIKAYAYKEGKRNSVTLTFGLPDIGGTRTVRYKDDGTGSGPVYDHIYFANDINEKKKVVKFYNGKGADDQWFTYDDDVSYYILYKYEGDTLKEEYKYTGSGDDGTWFTSDDTYEYVSSFTVGSDGYVTAESMSDSSGNAIADVTYTNETTSVTVGSDTVDRLSKVTIAQSSGTYPAKDINVFESGYGDFIPNLEVSNTDGTYKYEYTFVNDEKQTRVNTNADSSAVTWTYKEDETLGGIKEYSYEYQYDEKGQVAKKVKRLGYGTDTQWGYTDQTFDESGNVLTATLYWDNAGTESRSHYEYTYENNQLKTLTKYKTLNKEKIRYRKEITYNTDGTKQLVDYYNKDDEKEKFEEYTWDTTSYYLTKQRPDIASHLFEIDLEVEQVTVVKDGIIVAGGVEYDHNGDPASEIVDNSEDMKALAKSVAEKIKAIVADLESIETGSNSITIHGSQSGEVVGLISTYNNSTNIVFDFNEYNDGDIIIDGLLDLEMTATTIDISGKFKGSGEGYLVGEVYVADANPNFQDTDYLDVAITKVVTDTDGNIIQLIEYKTAGSDGDWLTLDDNSIKSITKYEFTSGKLTAEAKYKGNGTDNTWDTSETSAIGSSDDKVEYRIAYTYSGDQLTTEDVFRSYAIHGDADSGEPDLSLKYYLGWRLYWDIANRYEIDWDDDYWHEDDDEEDLLVWNVE
jgi:hypothetical protein